MLQKHVKRKLVFLSLDAWHVIKMHIYIATSTNGKHLVIVAVACSNNNKMIYHLY